MRAVRWVVAGLLLAGLAAAILLMAFSLTSSSASDITDLDVGDCFDLDPDDDGAVGLVEVVACDEPHNAEVVAIDELNPESDLPYPNEADLFATADARCSGMPPGTPTDPRFGILAVAPTEATWEARAGRVVCVALVYGGGRVSDRYGGAPVA